MKKFLILIMLLHSIVFLFCQDEAPIVIAPKTDFKRTTPIISTEALELFKKNLKLPTAQSDAAVLDTKYKQVPAVINAMKEGSNIIDFSTSLLWLEESLADIQSIWKDEKLRNTWDHISSAGTSIGLIFTGVVQLLPNISSDQKTNYSGIGIGVSGIATVLGYFLGDNSPFKIEDSILVIEMSRLAYDDLQERKNYIERYINDTNAYKDKLVALENNYNDLNKGAVSDDDKKRIINSIKDDLVQFDKMLDGMNEYFNRILNMKSISIFSDKIKGIEKLAKTRSTLLAFIKDAENIKIKYNGVIIPQIKVSDELKSLFMY
jgi:hypothetical protein